MSFQYSRRSGVIPVDPGGFFPIVDSSTRHVAFPGLARLAGGRLICVYADAAFDGSYDCDIVARFSSDNGRTWSAAQTLLAHAGNVGYAPGGVHVDTAGTVRVSYQQTTPGGGVPVAVRVLTSSDDCVSWTASDPVPTSLTAVVATSAPIIQLLDGTLILPIYGGSPLYTAALVRSTDGVTWGDETIITTGGGSWGEPNIVQRADGVLVCLLRECSATVATYRMTSTDNGASWYARYTTFSSTGGAPRIAKMASGALVALVRGVGSGRNVYHNSWDGGTTWQAETNLEATGVYSDYASPFEIEPGLLAVAYGRRLSSTLGSIRLTYLYDGWGGPTPLGTMVAARYVTA